MRRKIILIAILIVVVVAGGGTGGYFWYQGSKYVKTEDARIAGDIYRVMPRISGKVNSLSIKVGDTVVADQVIGQQDITNLANSLLDQATLRSPINGMVIQTSAKVGEVISPGQSVAMVVNKSKLYVSANIEETKIKKIKRGQQVDITVDTFPGRVFTGKVYEIGEATVSSFSLIPATSTSGDFTKVTQRIALKISIDDYQGLDLSPGMNASIKVNTKNN